MKGEKLSWKNEKEERKNINDRKSKFKPKAVDSKSHK